MFQKLQQKLIPIIEIIHLKFFGHEMSSEMRGFLKNLSWSFFGGIVSAIVMFGTNIITGRVLGPEEYGVYGLIFATSMVVIIPMTIGLETSITHYLPMCKTHRKKRGYLSTVATIVIISIICIDIGMLIFENNIAKGLGVDIRTVRVIVIFSSLLAIKNILDSFAKGFQIFRTQAGIKLLETAIISIFFIYIISKGMLSSSFVYIAIVGFGYLVFNASMIVQFRRFFRPSVVEWRKLISYGLYAVLGAIAGVLLTSFDKILINKYLGANQLGIYNAYAIMSMAIVSQLAVIFINVFFPAISSIKNKYLILNKLNRIAKFFAIPVFIVFVVLMYVIIKLMGDAYILDVKLIVEFSLLAILTAYFTALWWLIASEGLKGIKFTSINGIISGVIFVVLVLIYRQSISLHSSVLFSIIAIMYAIIIGNLRYLQKR